VKYDSTVSFIVVILLVCTQTYWKNFLPHLHWSTILLY